MTTTDRTSELLSLLADQTAALRDIDQLVAAWADKGLVSDHALDEIFRRHGIEPSWRTTTTELRLRPSQMRVNAGQYFDGKLIVEKRYVTGGVFVWTRDVDGTTKRHQLNGRRKYPVTVTA